MAASMDSQHAACASCGTALAGPYCSQCGEEVLNPEKLTLRYFFGNTVVSELFNIDGKIRRTLNLLLGRPGFLAIEYALGRRRPYLNPLRILIIAIIVFALGTMSGLAFTFTFGSGDFKLNLSVVPSVITSEGTLGGMLSRIDRSAVIQGMLERKTGTSLGEIPTEVGARFNQIVGNLATPLSFTVVLLLGLLVFLLFNRRRPLFVEHLVFGIHYYSFVLFTSLLLVIAVRLQPWFVIFLLSSLAVTLWQLAYLATAVRRFYLADVRRLLAWPTSVGVALLLVIFNSVFITGVQLASGAVAVWLL